MTTQKKTQKRKSASGAKRGAQVNKALSRIKSDPQPTARLALIEAAKLLRDERRIVLIGEHLYESSNGQECSSDLACRVCLVGAIVKFSSPEVGDMAEYAMHSSCTNLGFCYGTMSRVNNGPRMSVDDVQAVLAHAIELLPTESTGAA